MAVLLFFVNLVLIYYACFIRIDQINFYTRIRESFLYATFFISIFTFLQIQVLSAFNQITFTGIFIAQLTLFSVLAAFISRQKNKFSMTGINNITGRQYFIIGFLLLFFIVPIIYLCIIVPPNNSDAATCYLIRVEYWIRNHNIHHYPTQNLFELYYNQFPQFLMLNTRILSGSDYFMSIFQFFAYIGSAITVSLITKELGGKKPSTQILSAVICLCIPQAILQSSAAMYDLQSAFAASAAILYLIRIIKNPEKDFISNALLFSLAFAFTSYIKYSSVFFILLFPAAAGIYLLRRNFKKCVQLFFLLPVIFLMVHLTFFMENYKSFGSPISPGSSSGKTDQLINDRRNAATVTSGLVKNIAINFVSPLSFLNEKLYSSVLEIHALINVDINDPDINLNNFYEKYSSAISESTSGNLNITLLAILSFVILITRIIKRKKTEREIYIYLVCLFGGFIIFSSIFKFQSWNARLQLPFYILLVPPVSILLYEIFKNKKSIYYLLIGFCLVSAIPFIFMNYGKPIVSYEFLRKTFNKPPSTLNPDEFGNYLQTNSSINKYYQSDSKSSFLRLNNGLSSKDKRNVFLMLDSINYFRNEMSVLKKTRNQNYLVPGFKNSALLLDNYESVCDYLYSKNMDTVNTAFVLGHSPEYPLMAMIRNYKSNKIINWSHIRYYELKHDNINFRNNFHYDVILTNDSTFYHQVISPINEIKSFGLLTVIELMKTDTVKYRL